MDGEVFSISAQPFWQTWNLRSHVEKTMGIPSYEQHYAKDGVKLHSNDFLCSLMLERDIPCLHLYLARCSKPEFLSHHCATRMWQSFMVFSHDRGETIEGKYVEEVIRFGGLVESAESVDVSPDVPDRLTFPELMTFVAMRLRKREFEGSSDIPQVPMKAAIKAISDTDMEASGFVYRKDFTSIMRFAFGRNFAEESDMEFDDGSEYDDVEERSAHVMDGSGIGVVR
eukprot:TRINITY_DN2861_c0_g1_i1.p1 TRINITY_DN2861_c0_g1~~TRINITY_DN2861_c0_g1_i1.p1  ORF type:complete len:261 (-),score=21.49 TRINITY_DN2861_c0_g1_i1:437-1117(-)